MSKQKTVLTLETRSVSIVRSLSSPLALWCPTCEAVVQMVLPETAAVLCATSPREIYRRIETGELHFVETTGAELLVCCRSFPSASDGTDGIRTKVSEEPNEIPGNHVRQGIFRTIREMFEKVARPITIGLALCDHAAFSDGVIVG